MIKIYTGIGSRETPVHILQLMTKIGNRYANNGILLRSGHADGADLAFENGCDIVGGPKEIFLPWKKFNKSNSPLYKIPDEAFEIASTIHPAWDKLIDSHRKLHARNIQQVLGADLNTPTDLVICWTKNGKITGGTATAITLAMRHGIKVVNIGAQNV